MLSCVRARSLIKIMRTRNGKLYAHVHFKIMRTRNGKLYAHARRQIVCAREMAKYAEWYSANHEESSADLFSP